MTKSKARTYDIDNKLVKKYELVANCLRGSCRKEIVPKEVTLYRYKRQSKDEKSIYTYRISGLCVKCDGNISRMLSKRVGIALMKELKSAQ